MQKIVSRQQIIMWRILATYSHPAMPIFTILHERSREIVKFQTLQALSIGYTDHGIVEIQGIDK